MILSKLPMDSGPLRIAASCPSQGFALERILVADTAIQTLLRQKGEFNFSHIEPTGFVGCVMHLEALGQGNIQLDFLFLRDRRLYGATRCRSRLLGCDGLCNGAREHYRALPAGARGQRRSRPLLEQNETEP